MRVFLVSLQVEMAVWEVPGLLRIMTSMEMAVDIAFILEIPHSILRLRIAVYTIRLAIIPTRISQSVG
jgi:hypothetical protein